MHTVDGSEFLLELNTTVPLEVTVLSIDIHLVLTLAAFGYITVVTIPTISIHQTIIMMAFTHVNSLTAMETTFMKTLEYMMKTGAVSEEKFNLSTSLV